MSDVGPSNQASITGTPGGKPTWNYSEKQRTAVFYTVLRRFTEEEFQSWWANGKLPSNPQRLKELYTGLEHVVAHNMDMSLLPPEQLYCISRDSDGEDDFEEGPGRLSCLSEEEAAPRVEEMREKYLKSAYCHD